MLFELARTVTAASADPGVRLVSIEGAGPRAFSAGFDLRVLAEKGRAAHDGDPLGCALSAIQSCPKPVFAYVHGLCLGAAFDIAMCCDFRVATEAARFGVPAVRIGSVYFPRSIDRIRRKLGSTVTKQLFVLGRDFSAAEALHAGIAQEVTDQLGWDELVRGHIGLPGEALNAIYGHKHVIDRLDAADEAREELLADLEQVREATLAGQDRQTAISNFLASRE
jgi:enoyl-CoA hydratase/carnithine racemase